VSELPGAEQLKEVLELAPARRRRRRWSIGVAVGVAAVGVVVVAAGFWSRGKTVEWRTEAVQSEDLRVRVTAVGTIQPREVVSVGSEQSGLVFDVFVDENDLVTTGQPLALLDTKLLDLQHRESRAQSSALVAALQQARVVAGSRALDLDRMLGLDAGRAVAPADVDATRSAHDQAQLAVRAAEAQLQAARARLDLSDVNLDKAVIRSPIGGVVLRRNVDPGQSVVAALQAVTLFEVAADLGQLLVEVDVDEADVGRVKAEQAAWFTVSAWPEREFKAVVAKVHLAPDTTAGVVTYRAELLASNEDGALLPGMTATARIESERYPGALTVPLAALRFAPPDLPDDLAAPAQGQGRVWRWAGDELDPVLVELGPTDGVRQSISGVEVGDLVVLGRATATP
jgi:HlyD family secretion protein